VVTYKLFKPAFFVVSGVEKGNIFYLRAVSNKRNGTYAAYLFVYPDGNSAGKAIKSLNATFHF